MFNVVSLIDFSTLVSTIIGGLIVLWATYLTQSGKVYFYIKEKSFYYTFFESGTHKEIKFTDTDDPNVKPNIKIMMDIYNSSSNVKVLRDIQVRVVIRNQTAHLKPTNFHKKIDFINLDPKQIQEVWFNCQFPRRIRIEETAKVYLQYKNEKNKTKLFQLHTP